MLSPLCRASDKPLLTRTRPPPRQPGKGHVLLFALFATQIPFCPLGGEIKTLCVTGLLRETRYRVQPRQFPAIRRPPLRLTAIRQLDEYMRELQIMDSEMRQKIGRRIRRS